jgi:4-hydroxy-4-methyl-2-oxoglutarate aldolase
MENFISDLCNIDTPTLSNALELLDVRDRTEGYCDSRLRCLSPDLGTMVGYGVTATLDTSTPGPIPSVEGLARLFEAVEAAPQPSIMVFQEVGAQTSYGCHCGEVMATIGKRLGCVGVVSDAGVRDVKEVLALSLHYFALGCVASHGNFSVKDVNVPVDVAGLHIRPGDILHGDINGLITVPPELRANLADVLERIRSSERRIMEMTKAESFKARELYDVYGAVH